MFKKFEAKGRLLNKDEQLKFLATKLYTLRMKIHPILSDQNGWIYELDESGNPDWSGNDHQRYLSKARFLLEDLGLDFNGIITVLEII